MPYRDRDEYLAYQLDYYQKNKCKHYRYHRNKIEARPEVASEYQKQYSIKNKDKLKKYISEWQKQNKEKLKSIKAKRRAAKINRTPKWLTKKELKAISAFYVNCPPQYEVDHIIPLQGKTVSGLHVLANLQYLLVNENRSKGNRFETLSSLQNVA